MHMKTTKNTAKQKTVVKKHGLGIRGRIFVGFISIAVILTVTTLFISFKISTATTFSVNLSQKYLPTIDAYLDLDDYFIETQTSLNNYISTNNEQAKTLHINSWNNIYKTIN